MSPRPYQLGKRQEQVDEVRRRIIDAARALLAESDDYRSFTVEAVARQADVAKATVYYQFASKTGLLEALCDDLAIRGGMPDMPSVFNEPDPTKALHALVTIFGRFWAEDRTVMRRLRALAALDPEVREVISARDERRRNAIRRIVRPLFDRAVRVPSRPYDQLVTVLWMLTSFEAFDALTPADGRLTDANEEILRLVDGVVQ
jgi:AcrR family transcriptional regulator